MRKIVLISLLTVATSAYADNIVLEAKPASYTIPVRQDTQASAAFHVKMYNPTDSDMTMHYHASICVQEHENQCGIKDVNKVIGPKQWLDQSFGLLTNTMSFRYSGKFKVSAFIYADGTEHVENARYGEIWAY